MGHVRATAFVGGIFTRALHSLRVTAVRHGVSRARSRYGVGLGSGVMMALLWVPGFSP